MAHIINNIGWNTINKGKTKILSCMHICDAKVKMSKNSDMYDANKIFQGLERSAQAKRSLDADIFEREKRIMQSIESKKNML